MLILGLFLVFNLLNASLQQGDSSTQAENLINGLTYDCAGKPTGFYKDPKYCDIFHVCVGFQQRKTYSCPQNGDRFYYDEKTRRCEFSNQNPSGCSSGSYYQQVNQPPTPATSMAYPPDVNEAVEPWKQYVRQNEQFSCSGKQDGFYPSRWCNVFYRCYLTIKYEFLCAKQTNGDRLWWIQHSTSQSQPQASAQCAFPCDLKRQCTSPGGVLIENGNSISESTSEPARVINSCNSNNYPSVAAQEDTSNDLFRLPSSDNPCSGVPDGTYQSDSKYCNIFHVCVAGRRKDFLCAKASGGQYELWWNDATKRCEWPCKVQCSKQIFGGSRSASEIQTVDRNVNSADCGASSNNNSGNSNVTPTMPFSGYGK